MIGNAHPYRGYVIVEEGEINRQTLALDIIGFQVTDAKGATQGQCFATLEQARHFIDVCLEPS